MRKLLSYTVIICCLFLTSCSNNDDEPTQTITLQSVTSELVTFEYIQDTGNNSSRLSYKIDFTNPNFQVVQGIYRITLNIDGTETTTVSNAQSQCAAIPGDTACGYSFSEESPHVNGIPDNIQFVSAVYTITN